MPNNRKAKETILQEAPVTKDNWMAFYQSMDRLPRRVWGKVAQKVLSKKECFLYGKPYLRAFYDYDAGFDFNFDSNIAVVASNIFVSSDDSLPDPSVILWIMGADTDCKLDSVACIGIENRKVDSLMATHGIWRFKNQFGPQTVNSNDGSYFQVVNAYLKALND